MPDTYARAVCAVVAVHGLAFPPCAFTSACVLTRVCACTPARLPACTRVRSQVVRGKWRSSSHAAEWLILYWDNSHSRLRQKTIKFCVRQFDAPTVDAAAAADLEAKMEAAAAEARRLMEESAPVAETNREPEEPETEGGLATETTALQEA